MADPYDLRPDHSANASTDALATSFNALNQINSNTLARGLTIERLGRMTLAVAGQQLVRNTRMT